MIGTITMPSTARHDEIEAAMREYGLTFLLPGFEILELHCGSLFFQPEE